MQKWEYCVLTGVKDFGMCHFPHLYFFGLNGISQEVNLSNTFARERPPEWQKASESKYMAHIIAKLGSEGWEMVGTGTHNNAESHCIYFRRPID